MKVSVLCEPIQATQTIAFRFDQSLIPTDQQIDFQLHSWEALKVLDKSSRYQLLLDCAYLILSRWYEPDNYIEVIHQARSQGKKVFFHLDDNLFSVPKSVGLAKWQRYSSKMMLDALYSTAKLSDGIITATSRLADVISKVLPHSNILPCPFWKHFDPRIQSSLISSARVYPVIGYMGTQTHAEDLELISSSLDHLMSRNPSIKFETFGIELPKNLASKYPDRCSMLAKVSNYDEFQSVLNSLGWWLGLAPLTETQFNSCKTNTKFIEYIQAGIPVIASDFGPYENTPTIQSRYNMGGQDLWLEKIELALFSRKKRSLLYEEQFQYCNQFCDSSLLLDFYRTIAN